MSSRSSQATRTNASIPSPWKFSGGGWCPLWTKPMPPWPAPPFPVLLRDAHDYTCMFTDSRGQELVQGTFCTPGQAGAMALGVKKIIRSHP